MDGKLQTKGTESVMTKGYVGIATHADIPIIAGDLREADVAEVKAFSGKSPEDALRTGLDYPGSVTRTICLGNGLPVGMYGVCPTGVPRVGIVWMLAANRISTIHRQFLRESRERIAEIAQGYDLIFNFTDARNSVHHRWIKWAGFSIIKRHEIFGTEQRPFLEFARIVEKRNV